MVNGMSFVLLLRRFFSYPILALLLFSPPFLHSSAAEAINSQPQELRSFEIHETTQVARGCSYTVSIKTSCSSRRITRDIISLAFGDAYGNEVYAARLDDPSSGTFESCSTDTFGITGPCGYRTCYLYLRRSGYDGWTPEWVKVSSSARSITFYYGTPLPNGVWYGFNLCRNGGVLASVNAPNGVGGDGRGVA